MSDKREEVQKEALEISLKYKRCGLALSMRTGKTLIGLKRLDLLYNEKQGNIKVLVVAPKLSVFQAWKDDMNKFNLDHLESKITFSTYLSLKKQSIDYDIIILDEAHSLLPSSVSYLNSYNGIILGLTGTPPKSNTSIKGRIVNNFCPIVYNYITDTAVNDHVLNDYRIFIHKIEISEKKNIKVTRKDGGVFYNSEKDIYNFWSRRIQEAKTPKQRQISSVMRMKSMQGFSSKTNYTKNLLEGIDDKVIVFANSKEQANLLGKYVYYSGNKENEENLELFKQGLIDQLVCILQLSEGVTVPGLTTAVVTHSYGNERKFMQRFGRCLGLDPDDIANIHILCYEGTVDEDWVTSSLEDLDQNKIKWVKFNL